MSKKKLRGQKLRELHITIAFGVLCLGVLLIGLDMILHVGVEHSPIDKIKSALEYAAQLANSLKQFKGLDIPPDHVM